MKRINSFDLNPLKSQIDVALRHLLSEQNRDPYAPAYGCFDRRYWAWKLVDFPEATFQRNLYCLSWLINQPETQDKTEIMKCITAGLGYTFQIQHLDGSFDQAFPNEHSYGATAFLLHPLLKTYQIVQHQLSEVDRTFYQERMHRSAQFLCTRAETHGLISNHLAGAALSLLEAGSHFQENRFQQCGMKLINTIIKNQNGEGWFPEYGAADPGYQTLCVYYLAQAYQLIKDDNLETALDKSIRFLSWFVHPDGSFGGEYGSRRTAVYYSGGIALLSDKSPIASALTLRMLNSINEKRTVGLQDIDINNMAPLLQNSLLTYDTLIEQKMIEPEILPCDQDNISTDLIKAGISIRGTKKYYCIVGLSNGGVVKIFNKAMRAMAYDDGGYAGKLENGSYISTQMTLLTRQCEISPEQLSIESPFYQILQSTPSPIQFTLLRIMNLTIMHSIWIGNLIKKMLVNLLIQGEKKVPLKLNRIIQFSDDEIMITDTLEQKSGLKLDSLACGIPFSSIHMASARYYQGQSYKKTDDPAPVDVVELAEKHTLIQRKII